MYRYISLDGVVEMKNKKMIFILVITAMVFSFEMYNIGTSLFSKKVFKNEVVKQERISNLVNEFVTVKKEDKVIALENTKNEKIDESQKVSSIVEQETNTVNTNSIPKTPVTNNSTSIPEANSVPTATPIPPVVQTPVVDILETIKQSKDILGTAGRLYIPSVNVSVGLYHADITTGGNAQKIVDDKDSAAYFQITNQNVIADHNHQGFHKIINTSIGDKAYIKKANGEVAVYKMVNKLEGQNHGFDLTDLNGNSVLNGSGYLITYTCYKTNVYVDHVMIVMWELEK